MVKSPARFRTRLAAAVILVASIAAYGPTLANGFVYDDVELLVENAQLQAAFAGAPGLDGRPRGWFGEMLGQDFSRLGQVDAPPPNVRPLGYFRPVIVLSYIADAWFWSSIAAYPPGEPLRVWKLEWTRLNPVGFHLTNVLFHALNGLLVFLAVRTLTRRPRIALAAGLLFAVHPIHAESVCWIAGRTDVIATTFLLAALWAYLRSRRRRGTPRVLACAASLALFVVAALTKESTLVLPAILLALELILAHPRGLTRWRASLAALPFLAVAVIYLVARGRLGSGEPTGFDSFVDAKSLQPIPVFTLAATFLKAGAWYLGKCLWSFPMNLYADVGFLEAGEPAAWAPFLALHAALAILAAVLAIRRRAPILAFSVFAFYLSLGPVSSILPGTRLARFVEDQAFPVAERFLYVPSFFVVLALAVLFFRARTSRAGRGAAVAALALITAASVGIGIRRSAVYRTGMSFFMAASRVTPTSARLQVGIGARYLARYEPENALFRYRYARHLVDEVHGRANYPPIQAGLAAAYRMMNDFPRAVDAWQVAMNEEPNNPEIPLALANLAWTQAVLHMDLARLEFAHHMARRAVHQAPGDPRTTTIQLHINLARNTWNAYFKENRREDKVLQSLGQTFYVPAMAALNDPNGPRFGDAVTLFHLGLRFTASVEQQTERYPRTMEVRAALGSKLDESLGRARTATAQTLERFPGGAAAHFRRGRVLAAGGRATGDRSLEDEALACYLTAARLDPGFVQAVVDAGRLLQARDRNEEGLALVRAGVEFLLTCRPIHGWEAPIQPYRALDMIRETSGRPEAPAVWKAMAVEQIDTILGRVQARVRTSEGAKNADWWDDLGWFLDYAGATTDRPALFARAAEAFRKALALNPRHPRAGRNLEVIEEKLKQLESNEKKEKP